MRDKKGVSGIIFTIIMIVLVLAAVVIVWSVIINLIETQSEQVDVSAKCLDVNIQVANLVCSGAQNDVCDVTITRSSSGDPVAGIKLVFTNVTGVANFIEDVPGTVNPLETKTLTNITTSISNTNDVEVVPYFVDTVSGEEQLC